MLQDMIGAKFSSYEVEYAYLHFESLSDHSYEYNCHVCGYHPSIMIYDTFRKASFKYSSKHLILNISIYMRISTLYIITEYLRNKNEKRCIIA